MVKMSSSAVKLRMFGRRRGGEKINEYQSVTQVDELAQAIKEIQDMKECYDCLLSTAAATANNAYEFSQSLRDLGACLLERTALIDNEESAKVILMLGRVQFELQKLVDSYRSHIFKTIITPSESLLSELHKVEEMKRQCDGKRTIYEEIIAEQRENVRSNDQKLQNSASQQLQSAYDDCEEEATLCIFRMKSLKQGRARSLLTLAARHHAAQLNLFQKGFNFLETLDQHVRIVTEQHHIDYHFSELQDVSNNVDDGELTFDYRHDGLGPDVVMMEEQENSDPHTSKAHAKYSEKRHGGSSHSAPIPTSNKLERQPSGRSSSRTQPRAYVLPKPIDCKTSTRECAPSTPARPSKLRSILLPSPRTSPRFSVSPKGSKFHELPLPPASSTMKMPQSSTTSVHSAPLVYKDRELSLQSKTPPPVHILASPLPMPPPLTKLRSLSITSQQQYFTC